MKKLTKNNRKFQSAISNLYADNSDRIWADDVFEKGIFRNRVKLDFTNEYIQFLNGNRLYAINYENLALRSMNTQFYQVKCFRLQGKRRYDKEFWAYDTTSISSYSESLIQVKYGVNKDHDPLPQINLAMLYGETSKLPFYYLKLAGNISDVLTVKHLLSDMDYLGFEKIKFVFDRGFYSEANVNGLFKEHRKFIMGVKNSLNYVKKEIDAIGDSIRTWSNYNIQYDLYIYQMAIHPETALYR